MGVAMYELTDAALETAKLRGAEYADARAGHWTVAGVSVRNGVPGAMQFNDNIGYGVRVIVDGAWGFAACDRMDRHSAQETAARAVDIARAAAAANSTRVHRVPEPPAVDFWQTPLVVDPFKVPLEDKLDLLTRVDKILRADAANRIRVATSVLNWQRRHTWLASSEGTRVEQVRTITGGGCTAIAVSDGQFQQRSFPNSFGRQSKAMGWELINSLDIERNADRVREEAVALLTAPPCPSGASDVIITGNQLVLQIHESVGHPTELDRVLGHEANYAGTSFATPEKLGSFRYGSPIVNLVADMTSPTGLATMGYDDDGVAAQRWHIVRDGILTGYMTNRETAGAIGHDRSRGCNRADSWSSLPITRIANLSLMPGTWKLEDLIADTDDGLLLSTNRSWSIDQRRLNFQFGCEIGWRIKGGKLAGIVRNPSYQGITPKFWGSCDAICDYEHWDLWGVVNCGKGQPSQTSEMSHGAAPARFRGVTVGV